MPDPSSIADWCPSCQERTALVDAGTCPWCDAALRTRRRRGGRRPGFGRLSDAALRALHRAHVEQHLSINELAKRVYERVGYASHGTAATQISAGWKRLGLKARDRIEATRLASTRHGLAPKHGPRPGYGIYRRVIQGQDYQPLCAGRTPSGARCTRPAMYGSEHCPAHDPARQDSIADHLAEMRLRSRRHTQPLLPVEPFTAWLRQLHAELGTWAAVASRLGVSTAAAHRYGRGRGSTVDGLSVGGDLVRRWAAEAGTTLEDIYGEAAAA